MKKITLILSAIVLSAVGVNAQSNVGPSPYESNPTQGYSEMQVLSHTPGATLQNGAVACADTGGAGTTTNSWFRSYVPADFGFSGDFEVQGLQLAHTYTDVTGDGAPINVNINAWTSDMVFPMGSFTLLTSAALQGDASSADAVLDLSFDAPAVVDASTEVIVEFFVSDGVAIGKDVRIYNTADPETAPSYLASVDCGINDPVTTASIGFPDERIVLNLVGDEALAVDDNIADLVTVYPNPASNVLNVSVPSNIEVINASLYDVLGKNTGVQLVNGQMNTSSLARGVYILNVNTSRGTLTQKIVKQ
ncbi:T9SS type A sorting domain-containing protein [Aureitalea sp. L0-47]|uniref:T9SS type A sorting domain-containing protein n=1 Tax=Aureitalea sp. L0-47 TaxID=2816962 RepID=UPI00223906A5|nr:T9SS type A sorting domain-containing protein [Aureitalea sp. L0-47]MCW5519297.1 T9SS type A sorting domain-containing protein [Aureitalea sp. L0-47]